MARVLTQRQKDDVRAHVRSYENATAILEDGIKTDLIKQLGLTPSELEELWQSFRAQS